MYAQRQHSNAAKNAQIICTYAINLMHLENHETNLATLPFATFVMYANCWVCGNCHRKVRANCVHQTVPGTLW